MSPATGVAMDTPEFSFRELGALFDQSPIAMVFLDRELRARRANAALRRLFGLPVEALIGRRSSEVDHGVDAAWLERPHAAQRTNKGDPLLHSHPDPPLPPTRPHLP